MIRVTANASNSPMDVTVTQEGQSAVRQIGAESGYVPASVTADETVELLVNSTNVHGEEPVYEWLLLQMTKDGADTPLYLLSGTGLFLVNDVVSSLFEYTFPFDADDVTPIATLPMSALGLGSGDMFLYAYAYMNAEWTIRIDNIVAVSVQ